MPFKNLDKEIMLDFGKLREICYAIERQNLKKEKNYPKKKVSYRKPGAGRKISNSHLEDYVLDKIQKKVQNQSGNFYCL